LATCSQNVEYCGHTLVVTDSRFTSFGALLWWRDKLLGKKPECRAELVRWAYSVVGVLHGFGFHVTNLNILIMLGYSDRLLAVLTFPMIKYHAKLWGKILKVLKVWCFRTIVHLRS
jgi:hypothetical protein